ncbi:PREDICTED: uncharacterized protein LOC105597941 isoform X3 [Cercocebus atys]|uniref:uncharacterized protein LOC105597941 isoform X3 n=1 Tax=Cercocebus atys TaxID=9531 RepID=UPI0005F4CFB7|nr:PREDICTED: uncharacterized protein LOC105597941 isoform X3 [Cercocebus atys]
MKSRGGSWSLLGRDPYHQLFHDSGSPLQPSKASIKYCIPQHSQFTAEEIKLQVAQVYRMNQWQRLNSALRHLPPLSQILAKAYRKELLS